MKKVMYFVGIVMMATLGVVGCSNSGSTHSTTASYEVSGSTDNGNETTEAQNMQSNQTRTESAQLLQPKGDNKLSRIGVSLPLNPTVEDYRKLSKKFWLSERDFDVNAYLEACGATTSSRLYNELTFVFNGWAVSFSGNGMFGEMYSFDEATDDQFAAGMSRTNTDFFLAEPFVSVAEEYHLPGLKTSGLYITEDIISPLESNGRIQFMFLRDGMMRLIDKENAISIKSYDNNDGVIYKVWMSRTLVDEVLPNLLYSLGNIKYYRGIYSDFSDMDTDVLLGPEVKKLRSRDDMNGYTGLAVTTIDSYTEIRPEGYNEASIIAQDEIYYDYQNK